MGVQGLGTGDVGELILFCGDYHLAALEAASTARIAKDTPITRDMVDLDDNLVVRLRQEQDRLPAMCFMDDGQRPAPSDFKHPQTTR
jgi:hypothetical protein